MMQLYGKKYLSHNAPHSNRIDSMMLLPDTLEWRLESGLTARPEVHLQLPPTGSLGLSSVQPMSRNISFPSSVTPTQPFPSIHGQNNSPCTSFLWWCMAAQESWHILMHQPKPPRNGALNFVTSLASTSHLCWLKRAHRIVL